MSLENLFLAALDQPDAKSRDRYLEQACNGDAAVRGQVDELLAAHYRSGEFLDVPAIRQVREESGAENTVTMQGKFAANSKNHSEAAEELSFLAPSQRPDSLGRIGHYEVLQVLGKGGFGIVFRAFDDVLQRVVAIKVMAPQLAATSPARKRFLREARTSAAVRHENVVQVYEVAEHPLPYLAMEFIPGETLQQKLDRNGPLDVTEVLRIGRQIAEGLAAAHATDLIHRDIKPANVLIEGGPRQQVKITDFGLARAADDASISQSGIIAGTPMYMAPEQALGHKLDQRADLFSLGSVLYQMVSGRAPFRANSTVAVLKRVADETPRDIREIIPETPQWLCDIIAKLHAKDPDDRYQSAREVADVLADCEGQLKTNSKLKDFSRIPSKKPLPRRPRRARPKLGLVILALGCVLPAWRIFGSHTYRYVRDRGEVEFVSVHGLVQVNAIRDDNTGTDWVGVEDQPTIKLRPGHYQFNSSLASADRSVLHWEVKTRGLFSDHSVLNSNDPLAFEVRRGEHYTVRAVLRDRPDKKPPLPVYPGEWVPIFNGKDLAGWKTHPDRAGGWTVENGILVGRSNTGQYLFSERDDFKDFHLRTEVKVSKDGDSGVFFRSPFSLGMQARGFQPEGYEAEIFPESAKPLPSIMKGYTGSLTGLSLKQESPIQPEEWFTLEVIASGTRVVIKVNGATEADFDTAVSSQRYSRGHLVLQAISDSAANPTTVVHFRKIEIKEPPRTPAPEAKTPPVAVAPFTDADVGRIAALPAVEQVEEVRKELKKRNPGFDGKIVPTIKNDAVIGLSFSTNRVTDISPIRALTRLQSLDISSSGFQKGSPVDLSPLNGMALTRLILHDDRVRDLTPLRGMPLQHLSLWGWQGTDLSPLKGMPLKILNIGGGWQKLDLTPLAGLSLDYLCVNMTLVSDLSPLKNVPLQELACSNTPVSDLTPLRGMRLRLLHTNNSKVSDLATIAGMPLDELTIENTSVTDLSALKGLPLKTLKCDFDAGRDAKILRDIKTLNNINDKPVAEFWKGVDKK